MKHGQEADDVGDAGGATAAALPKHVALIGRFYGVDVACIVGKLLDIGRGDGCVVWNYVGRANTCCSKLVVLVRDLRKLSCIEVAVTDVFNAEILERGEDAVEIGVIGSRDVSKVGNHSG